MNLMKNGETGSQRENRSRKETLVRVHVCM